MNPSPHPEEAIVDAALALPPGERAAFLDKACGDDARLRRFVEALLRAHEHAPAPRPSTPTIAFPPLISEKAGDRIGRYKLLQQIGEGGGGVVYMAEQEEPVRRRVALKIIKLGMDTKQVIARFEAERQALALMDHPNIAKVHDAGATETGRPYFVMELVRGIKITDYCDQNNLPTEKRLDLFIQVCKATQHAHQKGIIHRDIKPSNILVTLHDGVPVPKVIDFGIAKATTGQPLTDKTVFTAFEQFIGTPAYMSPEQAEMSGLDIDTRSDIYSLGVLLYELLTGQMPFDPKRMIKAGLDEIRRIIREEDPPRPSTRISTLEQAEQTTVAKRRQMQAPALIHQVRGDLDWIVMKCLEKDRTRRYETANGIATEIERFLSEEPITARPPSNLYKFQKMARRNKLAFGATGAVAIALLVGFSISTWLSIKERKARQIAVQAEQAQARAREEARTEAAKSQQVARFLTDMLQGVGPSVALGRDTKMLREILDKTAERVGKDLTNQPLVEAELFNTLGEVYVALGHYEKAANMHREALKLDREILGNEHRSVAVTLTKLASALRSQRKTYAAETVQREALAMARKILGTNAPEVASALNGLSLILRDKNVDLPESVAAAREALAITRRVFGNDHPEVAQSLDRLGLALGAWAPRSHEAEVVVREALAIRRKAFGNEHPDVAKSLRNLSRLLSGQGRVGEEEAALREALAMQRKILGNDHPDVSGLEGTLGQFAGTLRDQGKLAEAETLYRELLAVRKKLLGTEHLETSITLNNLVFVLRAEGKLAEVQLLEPELLALQKKFLGDDDPRLSGLFSAVRDALRDSGDLAKHPVLYIEFLRLQQKLLSDQYPNLATNAAQPLAGLAYALIKQDKLAEGQLVLRELVKALRDHAPATGPDLHNAFPLLATKLLAQGKFAEAEPYARQGLAICERKFPDDWETFGVQVTLGASLLGQKKYAEAEPLLVSGYKGMKLRQERLPAYEQPRLKEALDHVVQLYQAWNKPDKVSEWKAEVVDHERARLVLYRKAAETANPNDLNMLAWFLATCEISELRDGPGAVAFAEKGAAATQRKDSLMLDTLAAAYAEAGNFEKAVAAQKEALTLEKDEKLKHDYSSRLKLYESKTPYREGSIGGQ